MADPIHAPIPPLPLHCPACDRPVPVEATHCPHCGSQITSPSPRGMLLQTLGVIVLGTVGLIAGSVGACSAYFMVGARNSGELMGIGAVVLLTVLVLVACSFGIRRLLGRK